VVEGFSGRLLFVAVLVAVLLLPASARGDGGFSGISDVLNATAAEVGVVHLLYNAPPGTQVQFFERVEDRLKALGLATATSRAVAGLPEAVTWRCDRTLRRFEATAIAPDGARSHDSYDVRTPSCVNRLKLSVPRRVALGATTRVRVEDRWKNGGVKPSLCITPPGGRRACRVLAFPRAVDFSGRDFRATKPGLWRVELRLDGHRVRVAVPVGGVRRVPVAPLARVLVTGDSMMQGLDGFLGDRWAETATVRSDTQTGSGVSRGVEWVRRAAAQAKRHRPRTTVLLMGDAGYPMRTPDGTMRACCDELWAAEYSRRARVMMKTYIRQGRGRVVWLTMPTPRNAALAAVTAVVNRALARADDGLAGARVVRLDLLLAPNGYREYMPYRGQTVRVRQTDGMHLTATGASIAAEAVAKTLRRFPGRLSTAP